MSTLIGDGSHARDIRATRSFTHYVAHHDDFHGTDAVTIGINQPQLRAQVAKELDIHDLSWVHPDAYLGPNVTMGYGTHVNYRASMTRTKIGRHCTISPGVTICGDVKIGDRVLVGAGATICDRVYIGNDVIIGAGAVVLPETTIHDGETWYGVPARCRPLLRQIVPGDIEFR